MQMEKSKSDSYCIVSKLKFEVFSLFCCKWKNYKSCGANSANSNCCGDRQEITFSIIFKSSFIYLKKKFLLPVQKICIFVYVHFVQLQWIDSDMKKQKGYDYIPILSEINIPNVCKI